MEIRPYVPYVSLTFTGLHVPTRGSSLALNQRNLHAAQPRATNANIPIPISTKKQ